MAPTSPGGSASGRGWASVACWDWCSVASLVAAGWTVWGVVVGVCGLGLAAVQWVMGRARRRPKRPGPKRPGPTASR